MFQRRAASELRQLLAEFPAVALTGPRQSGKTTLALELAEELGGAYLDLETPSDLARLAEPELYFDAERERLIVLDEVQRAPQLFPVLRGVIDRRRRTAQRVGHFLLLGSASLDLIADASESLAGRLATTELGPLNVLEIGAANSEQLWLRGGFPDSLLAASDAASLRWRQAFIATYLERDIPQLGPRIPAETLRRFWTMLAHQQGGQLNAAGLAGSLGVTGVTVARYLDLLVDLLLVRRLSPVASNVGKRLVKSPKVYVRDSGLVHALLGLATTTDVLGHPVAGGSWEGHVVEQVAQAAGSDVELGYYRTAGGAEIDLVLTWPDGKRWAIEVKRSTSPKAGRGFHSAIEDLTPERSFIVAPVAGDFPLGHDITAIEPLALAKLVAARAS